MSQVRSTRSDALGAITSGLVVVGFCLLLLWHDPLVFWNDDYELSVLPVFADVARSWAEGHLPLLSPYSWVCNNLAGEFQYGTFSIFVNAAVVFIWKFPLTFPQQAAALSITHLFVLAVGTFLLACQRQFSIPLSIFVALIAALNGWIICWGASDWFGAIGAFAWLPWAWWGLERALKVASAASRCSPADYGQDVRATSNRWRFLWPAPFVYLVVTGGFPYTVLMVILLIAWLSVKTMWERPQRPESELAGHIRDTKVPPTLMPILPMLAGAALGFGLSAPAWLAILDYVHGSAREMQPHSAHWQWLVPWRALPGLVLPCWTVQWADFSTRYVPHAGTELACGLVAPVALIAGFIWRGWMLARKIKWELMLLVLVLLLSMIPMISVFRWSFRWLPFFHLILALCVAESLRDIGFPRRVVALRGGGQPMFTGRMAVPPCGIIALLLVGLTGITMSILDVGGTYAFPLTWIFLAISAVWTIAELLLPNESLRGWIPAGVTFAALLATYFCIPLNCGVPKYNLSQRLLEPAPLDPQRLYLSIYPPPEFNYRVEKKPEPIGQVVRPGSTSMWGGVHFINGYSPILPAGVARAFNFAIHGEIDSEMGKYLLQSQAASDGLLARLGVDGIVVARETEFSPTPDSEWELVVSNHEGRIFHRRGAPLAKVRAVTSIDSRPDERFAPAIVSQINDSRNRVETDIDVPDIGRPALLTFSRPYFRGYEARLGQSKLTVGSYRGLMPLIEVPAESHGRLILSYRPWWLTYGGGVAIASCALFAIGSLVALRDIRALML